MSLVTSTTSMDEHKDGMEATDPFFAWSKGSTKVELGRLLEKNGYTTMHKLSSGMIDQIAEDCPNL